MTLVSFTRASDAPPPLLETLDIEADGPWQAWRSVGEAIGRFAGDGAKDIVTLAKRAADKVPPSTGDLPPDASVDRITLDGGATAVLASSDRPPGEWGELFAACRRLLDEAVAHPTAAIAIVVAGPNRVRLEHRGEATLPIELEGARIEATVWATDGTFVAAGTGPVQVGRVEAGPGWSLEVPLEGIDPTAEGDVVVFVSFVADDGGVYIPVMLAAGQAPG